MSFQRHGKKLNFPSGSKLSDFLKHRVYLTKGDRKGSKAGPASCLLSDQPRDFSKYSVTFPSHISPVRDVPDFELGQRVMAEARTDAFDYVARSFRTFATMAGATDTKNYKLNHTM